MLLSIQDLKVAFRMGRTGGVMQRQLAVKGISFDVPENGTVALVGESGSGKSVSMLALMGLIDAPGEVKADVLRFAAGLERGAVSAYLGAVPLFGDRALAQVAASILGDEAMHWAVLRQVLGETPVPSAFMA